MGQELVKAAEALGAAIPLTPIMKAILGPAADELGQRFGDRVRLYRYGRSLDMLKKAEKMAMDAGFTPEAVPIKLLFPLLEGASFEEDEDLHTMWAALLANAASPNTATTVRPGFIAVLKQMAPDEAALLNWIYERLDPGNPVELLLQFLYPDLGYGLTLETAENRLRVCLGGLESAGIVSRLNFESQARFSFTFQSQNGAPNFSSGFPLVVTPRGVEFVRACRPPKPKS